LILAGADQEINGKTINPSWQHSGGVDWEGNVYVIERDAHRIVKLTPKLDKFLLQLGVTNEKGTDATHLNLPSGIAILHNGNMVATWGSQALGPNQFDWVHGIVVDSHGAVYAADTYGQRIQKYLPSSAGTSQGR